MEYSDISAKINAKAYNPTAPYVQIKRFKEPTDGEIVTFMRGDGKNLNISEAIERLTSQRRELEKSTTAANVLYHQQEREGMQRFWDDVAEYAGLTNHPIRSSFEGYAWNAGHANGLGDVLCVYSNLLDSFLTFINGTDVVWKKGITDTYRKT